MRLGFVGVGRWAQKLAAAFRACGAEIVAYDRQRVADYEGSRRPPLDGFGEHRFWYKEMLGANDIDAIIAVAPPEVTTEVALACAAAGKPVMATKPLFDHPESIRAPFYVDFWRLWSGAHQQARVLLANFPTQTLTIRLYGTGPFRSFPGMFDWGPHVVAAMLDLLPGYRIESASVLNRDGGEFFHVEAVQDDPIIGPRRIVAEFGNATNPDFDGGATQRSIGYAHEEGAMIGNETKEAVLQRFCQSFLNDVAEGFVDTRLLELSRRGMEELHKIRELAGA